jgi:hypothetical protein
VSRQHTDGVHGPARNRNSPNVGIQHQSYYKTVLLSSAIGSENTRVNCSSACKVPQSQSHCCLHST